MLRRSTPNNKHNHKPRSLKCFRVNLAVADTAFLAVAAVALNLKLNETLFSRIRCFVVYRIRLYPSLFELLARTGNGGVSSRSFTTSPPHATGGVPHITVRLPCSYIRANQTIINRVLEEPGPRGTPVWNGRYYFWSWHIRDNPPSFFQNINTGSVRIILPI